MVQVIISGWREGLHKINMTKLIWEYTLLGLSEAKACTDRVLDGQQVILQIEDQQAAKQLIKRLESIGVDVTIGT